MELTVDEMVDELQDRLHISDADRIVLWLNEEQDFIQKLRDDWKFCLLTDQTFDTVDGTKEYDLVSNYMFMLNMRDTTNDRKLTPWTLSRLYKSNAVPTEEDEPLHYIEIEKASGGTVWRVKLEPTPDDTYTIEYDCYVELDELTTGSGTSKIPSHPLLMLGAEMRGRIDNEEDEDIAVIDRLDKRYLTLLQAMTRHHTFAPDKNQGMRVDSRMLTWNQRLRGRR